MKQGNRAGLGRRRHALALIAVVSVFAASGCSGLRARHSDRQGLLQRLEHGADSNPSHETAEVASAIRIRKHAGRASGEPAADDVTRSPAEQTTELAQLRRLGLRWPVHAVRVTSSFGKRSHGFHEGVDLKANVGTPVFAAQAGVVLYADRRIRGYGRMIIVRHDGGLSTVYAHNSRLLVRRGQRVKLGQRIAISGRSGHVSGPHVHFEVRKGIHVVDPERVIGGSSSPMAKLEFADGVPPTNVAVEAPASGAAHAAEELTTIATAPAPHPDEFRGAERAARTDSVALRPTLE